MVVTATGEVVAQLTNADRNPELDCGFPCDPEVEVCSLALSQCVDPSRRAESEDDYGDFVQCTRVKPLAPCDAPATRASRHAALDTYDAYWGNGWYILPNPMHGSWTSIRE